MKVCVKCKIEKPLDRFVFRTDLRVPKYRPECKDCQNTAARQRPTYQGWHKRNPDRIRANNRRATLKQYDLTQESYLRMLESQGHKCAICQTPKPAGKGSFKVDHCHETGKVRALLCNYCNVGLGHFWDRPNLLWEAIKYLVKYGSVA